MSAHNALGQTEFDAMLKELYPAGVPENVAAKAHPFMSMVKKVDDFEGDNLVVPVYYGNPAGRASDFATAQANARSSSSVKWNITQAADYAVILVEAITLRSSRSNRGAFVNARKTEIDMMLSQLGNSAAHALYRSGHGALGITASDPGTGTTITLTDADDSRNFSVGQYIVFADGADGSTARTGQAQLRVTAVDEAAGTLTVHAACSAGGTGIADGDYIFTAGDKLADGTLGQLKMMGLAGWLPLTTPSSSAFFGVDRTAHPTRLAGHRLNATGNSIEENILTLSESIVRSGGRPDKCFISHGNFNNLIKGLGTKVEYNGAGGKADVGFGGVQIHTSAGPVMVHPDPDCPSNRGYCLQMNTWQLHHLDAFPHIDTLDGNSALRQSTADGIEVRARYWANLACIAPGWNGVFAI